MVLQDGLRKEESGNQVISNESILYSHHILHNFTYNVAYFHEYKVFELFLEKQAINIIQNLQSLPAPRISNGNCWKARLIT